MDGIEKGPKNRVLLADLTSHPRSSEIVLRIECKCPLRRFLQTGRTLKVGIHDHRGSGSCSCRQ